jgi:hypothetical protein
VIIAMGVLAVGATTALALLVAATATGRRAEHLVNSAVIADSAFAEAEADLNGAFSLNGLEAVTQVSARSSDMGDGPIRAVPPMDPKAQVGDSSKDGKPPPPRQGPKDKAPAVNGPPRAFDEDPFATAKSYYLKKNEVAKSFPDYKYDVVITAVGGPPDDPWEFLVEVCVRWAERGEKRDRVFQTVLLKKITHLDNEPPPEQTR